MRNSTPTLGIFNTLLAILIMEITETIVISFYLKKGSWYEPDIKPRPCIICERNKHASSSHLELQNCVCVSPPRGKFYGFTTICTFLSN